MLQSVGMSTSASESFITLYRQVLVNVNKQLSKKKKKKSLDLLRFANLITFASFSDANTLVANFKLLT